MQWNVYRENFNKREIEVVNILDSRSMFVKDIKDRTKKYIKSEDKEMFCKEVMMSLMYYYWSKAEHEVIITSLFRPEGKEFAEKKIDIYSQVKLNEDIFLNYLWENRKELLRSKRVD